MLNYVLSVTEQLLEVLAAAHAQSIVHRDLKPANIFVTRKGVVKILDFGIARLREGDGSKTESGTTLGTPLFMPPEQASGRSRDVDGRTDLWAVGATMFSLLSGQFVHDGENAAQVLIAVATTPSRSLASVAPHVPPEIVAIVDKALAFHNEDRWASALEMRAAVVEAQVAFGSTVSREDLGHMVRATGPGAANNDVQSTPATTPAPGGPDQTERMATPPGFGSGPHAQIVGLDGQGLNATKRSAGATAQQVSIESSDSSARAITSPVARPARRSKTPVVLGAVAIGLVAVGAAAMLRGGFASHAAVPVASQSALPTPVVVPSVQPAPEVQGESSAPGALPPEVTKGESSAAPSTPARHIPPAAITSTQRRLPHGPKATSSTPLVTPVVPVAVAPPAPVASPPPAQATPATPHKPPPVLDRTSPFGN
jgi:serine/threonine-protein kinase